MEQFQPAKTRRLFVYLLLRLSRACLGKSLVFAKRNPSGFLNLLTDPKLKLQSQVQSFFDNKLLAYRNKKRDVYYNLEGNKKRMTTIPFGVNPNEYLADWFTSDDGIEVLKFLETQ